MKDMYLSHPHVASFQTCVVARVESLPLASLGDFVRGRMGESTRQVERLFESLLAEAFEA